MTASSLQAYQPLNQHDEENNKVSEKPRNNCFTHLYGTLQRERIRWASWTTRISWVLVICLIVSNWYTWVQLRTKLECHDRPTIVFSPASSVIKYENVVFQAGIDSDTSPYQGPISEASDEMWEELHKHGVSKIPREDAAQLTNRTSPIPGDEENYVVILEVFHQLHCLSHIRRRLFWNETTMGSPDEVHALAMKHLDHCIDSIRQSLMCSADITPLPFVWWRKYDQLMPASAVTHTCRDFSAIQDWAKEHTAGKFDHYVRAHDPLGDQVVYDV